MMTEKKRTIVKTSTQDGLLDVLSTRRLIDELELPAEMERACDLRNAKEGDEDEDCACNSSKLLKPGVSPRRGDRNSVLGLVRSPAGEPNV